MAEKETKIKWNAPYDKRSSDFINVGFERGVGKRQPVGHENNPKQFVPCMPFGTHEAPREKEI